MPEQVGCFSGLRSLRPRIFAKSASREPTYQPSDATKSYHAKSASGTPCSFPYDSAAKLWTTESQSDPPAYGAFGEPPIFRPEVLGTIETTLDKCDQELRKLSLKIHAHPEIGFEEVYAHDTLTSFMSSHGFEVTRHYLGLKTAWKAEFEHGNGGRVLGINSEMDALPGIGHACGHNLIAISGVGVALGVKAALQKHQIPGKIILLGTPAEEGGGGKNILIDRGGYKDMDICLMCHPGPGPAHSAGLGSSLASQGIEVEFFGHSAHAGAAPWEGQNALDAAFLAYSNISVLRQQMKPEQRVHGIIEGKNWAPNIIPDYAKMRWIVRAATRDDLVELVIRIRACLDAAALAASCRQEIVLGQSFYDLRQNSVLSKEFADVIKSRYGMITTSAEGAIGGSTDFGNVTYELPALHPAFAIPTVPNGGNHTSLFTDAARTMEAHKATIVVTKGLALTGLRALNDDSFFLSVKKSFDDTWKVVQ